LPVPKDIVLKPLAALQLVGKPTHRLDARAKSNGSAVFGIDVQLPGMKVAAVAACPVFGGKLGSVDAAPALKVKGVRKVVKLHDAVAVIADHTGAARKGLAALEIKWDEGPNAKFSTEEWLRQLEQAGKTKGRIALDEGKPPQGGRRIDAVYHAPLMAHATMEPMNCTALVGKDSAEIWTGTQAPARAQKLAAEALKLDPAKVIINNHYIGGGFGRRLDADYVVQAALIAREVNYPVKLIWSREEDMQHGQYRPYYRDELSATVDQAGVPTGFSHRVIGSSVRARYAPAWLKDGLDTDAVAAAESLYDIGHKHVEYCAHESPVPSGFWRGVGPTHNTFVVESFVDELAAAAHADPLAYRMAMLGKQPRASAALALAARMAGWSSVSEPGTGMGLSVMSWWGSAAACVVQCVVNADGQVALKRVVIAVDCGLAVNPDGVIAQIEGGAIYALSAGLYGKLTVENGRIAQSNFHDYPVVRMNEMPVFEIHLMPSGEPPGGVGELGTAVLGPALANAVFAASGKRTRTLPVL
jgi:CO/xanthine dehydrogenase Mo-binding subunit